MSARNIRIIVMPHGGQAREFRLSERGRRVVLILCGGFAAAVIGLLTVALVTLLRTPSVSNAKSVLAGVRAASAREHHLKHILNEERKLYLADQEQVAAMRRDLLRAAAAYSVKIPNLATSQSKSLVPALGALEATLPKVLAAATAQTDYLLHMPDFLPASGPITSGFGWRPNPFGGPGQDFHQGVDIGVPYGTPISAPGDGVVLYAGWYSGYGNYVQVNHGYGIVTTYGHLSSIVVHVGESVSRGQLIGYTGDTGYSTGPHLDFAVHVDGIPVNPITFLDHIDSLLHN